MVLRQQVCIYSYRAHDIEVLLDTLELNECARALVDDLRDVAFIMGHDLVVVVCTRDSLGQYLHGSDLIHILNLSDIERDDHLCIRQNLVSNFVFFLLVDHFVIFVQ